MTFKTFMFRLIRGTGTSHIEIKKHSSMFLFILAIIVVFLVITLSISLGPSGCYNPITALSSLFSAAFGSGGMTEVELVVFDQRFPRTVAALAVGIGLSIAGCVYQAVIRNPLVDPYIMGVSSGSGTTAIASIAFGFTLFGLVPSDSIYLTAIMAIIGGLLAFGCTMIIGELAGGSNNAYVLSGVVVGLIFSAIQTVLIIFAGEHLSSVLLWLFGSFSQVTYKQAIPIFFVAIALSLICLKWSKELNLILLGEDQARQMGLNAHRFSMFMLILASVLTSVCVAFVGIIGFVGLVVPHFCRMLFGGDHRLVMPASIAFGGALMVAADIASRMLMSGYELPVGAITTLIGVPVFAYLLFKKGKMYNG